MPSSRRTFPSPIALVLVLAALIPDATQASGFATLPEPYSARYEGRHRVGPVTASARVEARLERQGNLARYTMDIDVRLLGLRRRLQDCSLLRRDARGWGAVEFRHIDHGDQKLSVHTRFANGGAGATGNGEAVTTFGDGRPPAKVSFDGRAWDPLSFQLLLSTWALLAAPAAPAAASAATSPTPSGTSELTEVRVVERGTLKRHRVGAPTALPIELRGRTEPGREIVSRKESGDTILLLLVSRAGRWLPGRIVVDGVTMELTAAATPALAGASELSTGCPT